MQTLRYTKHERWTRFVATLGLDVPLEFNEGDVGMAGGIQADSAHMVVVGKHVTYVAFVCILLIVV